MNKDALELRELLTKHILYVEKIYNTFDEETLKQMGDACVSLFKVLSTEIEIVKSVQMKAMVLDDMYKLRNNFRTIATAIKMKRLEFKDFCLN